MDTQTTPFNLLADLEARHDDLLLQLEQLDKRVEETLAECQTYRAAPSINSPPE